MQCSYLFKINFLSRDRNFQYGGLHDHRFEFLKSSYLLYFKPDFHEIFNKLNFSSSSTMWSQLIISWVFSFNTCICDIKFSRFSENDILVYFNFSGHDIPWLQMVNKIWCKFVTFFLNFLLNNTLCHLLESPHWGDSNRIPQCILWWIVKKLSQILGRFSIFICALIKLCI